MQALYEERRAKALRLNVRGRSYEAIAQLSREEKWEPAPYMSRQAVFEDVKKALAHNRAERESATDEFIQKEIDKLDAMEEEAWRVLESLHYVVNQGEVVYVYPEEQPERVKQGWAKPKLRDAETREAVEDKRNELLKEPLTDNKPVLDALTVLLKIAERRTKLLGWDAPIKKQVDVSAGGNINDRIAKLFLAELAAGGQGSAPAGADTA